MKINTLLIALICFVSNQTHITQAAGQDQPGVALTIYNQNFGVVREMREMSFEQGVNEVRFTDVASAIDPTSVNFRCLSAPGEVSILEQNYEYDLVNTDGLLKRYIDRNVSIAVKGSGADTGKRVGGTLLAAPGTDLIVKNVAGGIEIIHKNNVEEISLSELPEDLVTKPTLVWLAEAKAKGSQLCRVTYSTERINWHAEYSALLSPDDTKLDFSGWVTIDNRSGAAYKDARIKLIAGDVRRIRKPQSVSRERMMFDMGAATKGFEEKPFMEYHLYTLGRRSTIRNNQVKQIEFIEPASDIAIKKLYIYERSKKADKIQVKLEFENTAENKLGIALPKGKVRVFKKNPDDEMLEFVGEDEIDHTPREEKLTLYIGDAFDIAVKYTLLDSEKSRRMRRETHKIELRNRKQQPVTVFVDETFARHVNWVIDSASHEYEKRDAYTARFKVPIKADSVVTVRYTVTQTW